MRIPIVMVSDTNYISQTRVAIWTMRKNTCRDVLLEVTILCPDSLTENERYRLKELESMWYNLKITFYDVNYDIFIDAKPVSRIPVTSFYRLIISEVLKEDERCLFLDGDLIVNTDLRNLYLQDVGDAYIAGVRDSIFLCAPDNAVQHFETYGFQAFTSYVNAGVMLFNLSQIRKDNVQKQFIKCMDIYYPYMDQDILNKVCERRVKLLDLKYNFFSWRKNTKVGEEKKWEILHFVGADKPWDNLRIRGAKEWWLYAEEALEEEIYKVMYERAEMNAVQGDWSYLLNRCMKEKTIIIVGYSNIGTDVFTSLKRCNVKADMFFCDNSKLKQALGDENIKVFAVENLALKCPGALWINTSQHSFKEINDQLKNLGIIEDRIIVYRKKGETYFEMLDDAYIDYELRQVRLKALGE